MANMRTLARLHQEPARQPQPEQVQTATVADSQPDVPAELTMLELAERSLPPVRRRFAVRRERPEVCRFNTPDLMSIMHPSVPMNRAEAFAELAQQERLMRMARRLAARRSQEFPVPPQ
jgi:hypothetical protein